jgi:hypothetical protein
VTVAVGAFFGFDAIAKQSQANCPGNVCADQAHLTLLRDANSAATVSTVLFVAGGLVGTAGGVVWLLAPSARRPEVRALNVVPVVAGRSGALLLSGSW